MTPETEKRWYLTKMPWRLEQHGDFLDAMDANDVCIARMEIDEIGPFMVRAVNAYYDLLNAAKWAKAQMEDMKEADPCPLTSADYDVINALRSAIAKAESKSSPNTGER